MSYRVSASNYPSEERNDHPDRKYHQLFGNNEFPKVVHDYLESVGCEFDEDDCFHDFEIKDIQGFLDVFYEAHNQIVEDDSYWDMKPTFRKVENVRDLIEHCWYKRENAYVFMVYNFYETFEKEIETVYDDNQELYRIKEGKHIYISGY